MIKFFIFVAVISSALSFFFFVPYTNEGFRSLVLPEFITEYAVSDSTHVVSAHRVLVLCLWVGCMLAAFMSRSAKDDAKTRGIRLSRKFSVPIALSVVILLEIAILYVASTTRYGGPFLSPGIPLITTGAACFVLSLIFERHKWFRLSVLIVAGIMLAGFSFGSFWVPVSYAGWNAAGIVSSQLHYNLMFGSWINIMSGLEPVSATYGIFFPLSAAALIGAGTVDGLGSLMRFVQLFQPLALLLIAFAALRFAAPESRHFAALLVAILAGPLLHSTSLGFWYPNQSGLRYFGMVLALLCLTASVTLDRRWLPIVFGATASIILTINIETGIPGTIALLVTLFVREQALSLKAQTCSLGRFVLSAALAGVVIFAAIYGYRIDLHEIVIKTVEEVGSRSGGYGGFLPGLNFHTITLFVVVGHAMWIVIAAASNWAWKALDSRSAAVLGMATMIVVWLGYYANRAVPWNTWFLYIIYVFLLIDAHQRCWVPLLRRPRAAIAIAPIATTFVFAFGFLLATTLVPFSLANTIKQSRNIYNYASHAEARQDNAVEVSEVLFSKDIASAINDKAGELREISRDAEVGYLSMYSFVLAFQTNMPSRLPLIEPFTQAALRDKYIAFVRELNSAGPQVLLVDSLEPPLRPSKNIVSFFNRVTRDIEKCYQPEDERGVWIIFRRKSRCM